MRIKRIKHVVGKPGWGDWFYFSLLAEPDHRFLVAWHPHFSEPLLAFFRPWRDGDEGEKVFSLYCDIELKKPYVFLWACKPTKISSSPRSVEEEILEMAADVVQWEENMRPYRKV